MKAYVCWWGCAALLGAVGIGCGSSSGSPITDAGGSAGEGAAGTTSTAAGSPGSSGGSAGSNSGGGSSGGSAGGTDAGGVSGGDAQGGSAGSAPDPGSPSELGVNDVSYVWPLPEEGQVGLLLGLSASGAKGALLSQELSDEIVQPAFPRSQGVYDSIRVVALRLDPCAGQTEVTDKATCQSEIRLVTQPMDPGFAFDAGVHLTYRVSRAELDAALAELLALKAGSDVEVRSAPLGRHPILVARNALDGPFAKGLKAVVLKYVGMSNLALLTEFSVGPEGGDWLFDKFEKNAQGKFVHASIPLSLDENPDTIGRQFIVEEGSAESSRMTAIGDIDFSVGFPESLLKSSNVPSMAPQALADALNRLAAIEDPNRHSAVTVDCGSCHEAGNARGFYEKLTGSKATALFSAPAGQNVTRQDDVGLDASSLHALSYMGQKLQISPRAINESARVADWLGNGF